MVEVRYHDRLGNNLFQYCLGRIIAEEMGMALRAEALPGFPNTATVVAGAVHHSPEQVLTGHRIDLGAVLADRSPRKIVLDGWFQRHEYYGPYRTRIQQWLATDPAFDIPCENADLVINVRRTDYVGLGWALPFSYYKEAIERALPKGGRIVIVTDDPADTFFWRFRRWRTRFFRGSPIQQLSCMTHAPRFVMSASTFSWWPTFLGNPNLVVCPAPSFGPWSASSGHEINLVDRDRFISLSCDAAPPSLAERLYQRTRAYRHHTTKWLNRRLGLKLPVQNY